MKLFLYLLGMIVGAGMTYAILGNTPKPPEVIETERAITVPDTTQNLHDLHLDVKINNAKLDRLLSREHVNPDEVLYLVK